MPHVTKFLHTRYRVADLAKTVAFYRDVLGLEQVSTHTSSRGSELVFLKAPGSEELLEICKFDKSGPIQIGPDLTHLAFEVDDIVAFGAHAAALGYPYSEGPSAAGGKSSSCIAFIDAPEGYEVEIIEKKKP